MKKMIIILAVIAVGIGAFTFVGNASAQEVVPAYPGNGGGNGPRGGNGNGTDIPLERNINLDGLLDDVMTSIIANELGITVDELKSREAAGETLVEIGLSLGFDAQAVIDGQISQEQADWLISRLENGQYGINQGLCMGDCAPEACKMMRNANRGNRPITP